MPSTWSQRRGHYSGRWSLLLLLGLLKLFGIAEAITLREMTTDISSLPVIETKVISRIGENVTLYCRTDFPLLDFSVSWYYLSQDGSLLMVQHDSFEDDYMEQPSMEFYRRTILIIKPGMVLLILKDVRLQDSGTYKCVQKTNEDSVERYVILQVIAPKEKDENSVVIYTLVGFLLAGLVVWLISFGILCKRGDLQWYPRNWGQERWNQ